MAIRKPAPGKKGGKKDAQKPTPPRDVALVGGPTPDGQGAQVLRVKDGAVSTGELRPAREGQPLHDQELVRLKPMHPQVPLCEVESLHGGDAPANPANGAQRADGGGDGRGSKRPERSAGPARVASDVYRKNWSAVFGSKPTRTKGRAGKSKRRDDDWSMN